MNLHSSIVLVIFIATIFSLIRFQKHPAHVFGLALLTLYCLDLVSTEQVIRAGSNEGLLTLILLMMCSIALEKTRVLRLMANLVIRPSFGETFARLFGFTVVFSAFLNNTAVVSSLLAPIRNNPHHSASKLLLPLSYAAILGGTLTLIGTSTNLIVNSLLIDNELPPLAFFDFTAVGLCVVIMCGGMLTLLCRFLPSIELENEPIDPYPSERQLYGIKEKITLLSFITALVLASLGLVTLFKAMLVLFGLLLFFGVLSIQDIAQRFPYHIWLIITSAIAMSFALQNSGLFDTLNAYLQTQNVAISPQLALVGVFVMTLLLTELVTNNAAAAVTFPIAYSLSLSLGANPIAFVMAVAFGASASFISPYGYQTNLMVFNAGQYRLTDFVKIGTPVSVIYSCTAIVAIEYFFGV